MRRCICHEHRPECNCETIPRVVAKLDTRSFIIGFSAGLGYMLLMIWLIGET